MQWEGHIVTTQRTEAANRATIERLVSSINARDPETFARQFAEDTVVEWPQSGERIVGRGNLFEIYRRMPSLPKVSPRRVTAGGDLCVLEANVDYGDGEPYLCAFLFELRDGLIAKETGYWSKPFPAAENRAAWVERM
jgi:hypothetical protein